MMLVYVVGADGGATTWKLVLVGLTMFGIIFQVSRGRSKGKSFADSLVDDDSQEIKEFVDSIVDKVTNRSHESEE
jgi:hypothetical protein